MIKLIEKVNNIVISPLDWGLGHTTRIIPLVHSYLKQGVKITIACNNLQKQILEKEFDNVSFIHIKGYGVKLSAKKNQTLKILFQIPKILTRINQEKTFIKEFIESNNVDLIISDNRYGFRSNKVKSVIVTHQTYIKTPLKIKFFEHLLNSINTKLINKFDECWVPDVEGEGNISGELSHKNKQINNIKYIGILSRFEKVTPLEKTNKVLAIISGPEPQRTLFENIVVQKLAQENYSSIIVRGTNIDIKKDIDNICFVNMADSKQLQKLIAQSEHIISRSGYSSILDYVKLGINAILVPTPGQTEQEYLAEYLSKKRGFTYIKQEDFNNYTISNT